MKLIALNEDVFDIIETYNIDALVNAANGTGPMGRGIAGAIKHHGGIEIQSEAIKACNNLDPQPGSTYVTSSGKLQNRGIKKIIHAVVMKLPGGYTDYNIVRKAFFQTLYTATNENVNVLGCTAFGTGVGCLNPIEVAKIMYNVAFEYESKIEKIIFADFNEEFISTLKGLIK
jgi:O-acetyl-ADP-ribose deacetylase (regulator of RNase III)